MKTIFPDPRSEVAYNVAMKDEAFRKVIETQNNHLLESNESSCTVSFTVHNIVYEVHISADIDHQNNERSTHACVIRRGTNQYHHYRFAY